jgi:DNA polymerase
MKTLILDWETYYDDEYSLSKMTSIEYIMDSRFKAHGAAIAEIENGRLTNNRWLTGNTLAAFLLGVDWDNTALVGHNLMFDAGILGLRLNLHPKRMLDTLSMSRSIYGASIKSHSLASVYQHITGKQGKVFSGALTNVKGVRDLTVTQEQQLGSYAMDDVRETFDIFMHMFTRFPPREYDNMHDTIRMFTKPQLRLDPQKLNEYYTKVSGEKEEHIERLNAAGIDEKQVSSNQQCQQLLLGLGVDPDVFISPKTGKVSLSKANYKFSKLQESDDLVVGTVVQARLNIKSTIKKSRAETFIRINNATGGMLPAPLAYCGAKQTNRMSGQDNINLQNMPRGAGLRNCIVAPKGYKVVVADLSNIELRTNMVMCRQQDAIDALIKGEDLYCMFASRLYSRVISKSDKLERQVGKVAELSLGYRSGHAAFRSMLFTQAQRIETEQFCKFVVDLYRNSHPKVKQTWYALDEQLVHMSNGAALNTHVLDAPIEWHHDGIVMPSGFKIKFPNLRRSSSGEMVYLHHTKLNAARAGEDNVHGGVVLNACNQSIARDVIMDVHARVKKETGYRMALQAHDELVYVSPEKEAQDLLDVVLKHMHTPPTWWPSLPVKGEGSIADNYGDAK